MQYLILNLILLILNLFHTTDIMLRISLKLKNVEFESVEFTLNEFIIAALPPSVACLEIIFLINRAHVALYVNFIRQNHIQRGLSILILSRQKYFFLSVVLSLLNTNLLKLCIDLFSSPLFYLSWSRFERIYKSRI